MSCSLKSCVMPAFAACQRSSAEHEEMRFGNRTPSGSVAALAIRQPINRARIRQVLIS